MSTNTGDKDRLARETRQEAELVDRRVKVGLLTVSCVVIVLLVIAALGENVFAPWRTTRGDYQGLLHEVAEDELGQRLAQNFDPGMDQIVLAEQGQIDRCNVCHTGIDDPRMAEAAQPFHRASG